MYEFEKNKLYNFVGKDLAELFEQYECFVAGGLITSLFCNREINDIDVYFRNEQSLIDFIYDIWDANIFIVAHTKKATLIKHDNLQLQLIHFDYFDDHNKLFDTFDFTVCMGCFDFKTKQFVLHDSFMQHNSQRILKYNPNTAFPIVSLLRVQKYEKKGYKISKPELIRIVLSCMNLDIDSYEKLKDQMGGMYGVNYDKAFAKNESEHFDLMEAIDMLKELCLDDDYFKEPEKIEFDDVEDVVDSIAKEAAPYFEHKGEYYKVRSDGSLSVRGNKPVNGVKIDPVEFFSDNKFYKFVYKDGDAYRSFYDTNFVYKIGEWSVARGKDWTNNPALFFNEFSCIDQSTYSDKENRVLIEVKIDFEDFIDKDSRSIRARKCLLLREVPKSEYEQETVEDNDLIPV